MERYSASVAHEPAADPKHFAPALATSPHAETEAEIREAGERLLRRERS